MIKLEKIASGKFDIYDNANNLFATISKRGAGYKVVCLSGSEAGKIYYHSKWEEAILCCVNILRINSLYLNKINELLEKKKPVSLNRSDLFDVFRGEKESLKLFLTALNLKEQNKLKMSIR